METSSSQCKFHIHPTVRGMAVSHLPAQYEVGADLCTHYLVTICEKTPEYVMLPFSGHLEACRPRTASPCVT